jgi:hypothetical protein
MVRKTLAARRAGLVTLRHSRLAAASQCVRKSRRRAISCTWRMAGETTIRVLSRVWAIRARRSARMGLASTKRRALNALQLAMAHVTEADSPSPTGLCYAAHRAHSHGVKERWRYIQPPQRRRRSKWQQKGVF